MSRIDMCVVCPYYVRCKSDEIMCEGIGNDMRVHNTFSYPSEQDRCKARLNFMRKYCCKDYKSCVLAKALETKYV